MIEKNWINPLNLKTIREKMNLSVSDVEIIGKKLKSKHYEEISSQKLREWEEGKSEPELSHLETLAEIYQCPVGYFFLDKLPEENIPFSYRGLSLGKSLSYTNQIALKRFYELSSFIVSLIKEFNIQWEVKIQHNEIQHDYNLIDTIADEKREFFGWNQETRKTIGNNEEAFQWWRKKIENLGIFCFELKFEAKEFRGASSWLESYPFILINRLDAESATGRIFTLLHEYIHLISQKEGILCDFRGMPQQKNPEPFVNKLSAKILLNHDELKEYLQSRGTFQKRNWSDREIDEIRKPFFVSRDVIAISFQEMKIADENFYEQKIKKWNERKIFTRRGKRPTKKEQKFRELGYSSIKLLTTYYKHPSFPLLDLSYILDTKLEKTSQLLDELREYIEK